MLPKNLVKAGLLLFTFLISVSTVTAQLNANFTASTESGCAPIVVQFQDLSTGNPNYWYWDLGNGTTSYLQNPSVTYFDPGQYNVKLVVRDSNGEDSVVKTAYINVYALPQVNFSSSVTSGCYPLNVQFTDGTQNASGSITNWYWDFGDGISSDQANPMHTYTAQGSYNVSLWVKNSFGCSNTITRSPYITVANGIDAGFTHSQPTTCFAPTNVQFQNTTTGTGTLSYLWDFGDGNTSTDENPDHTYTGNGSFTVSLIVTNNYGCTDTAIMHNTIVVGNLNAGFTAPAAICAGTQVTFTNTSNPAGADAQWDFGDGTTSTDFNPNKSFATEGNYIVRLIAGSGSCSDTTTQTINVQPIPTAGFTASNTTSCSLPLTVNFQNISTGAVSYAWNFGDGNTSTAQNPSHTYTSAGTFTVKLTVTNTNGCTNTYTANELVVINPPTASINDLPQEGCAPLTWTFTPNVTSAEPIASYWWDFGDGTTSTDESPEHIFSAGTFNVTLAIVTQSGCTDTITVQEAIRVGDRPLTGFTATPRVACAKTPVVFTDTTIGNVDRWLWDFGDGGTSVRQHPEHEYRDTGYFDVTLIVWNMGCVDTLLMEDYIRIEPPIAKISVSFECSDPYTRIFRNRSIGADTYIWDFADGHTSTEFNPTHVYTAPGDYRVMLAVFNAVTGCSDTAYQTVSVYDVIADFETPNPEVCRKTAIPFNATNVSPYYRSYEWDFGDGGLGTGSSVHHTYHANGYYTVRLIVTGVNNCSDTIIKTNYIDVSGPKAGFVPVSPGTCNMSPIAFTDTSSSDGVYPITTWTWNYGDGTSETLTGGPFIHTYNAPGTYSVELTVTDTRGCTDKVTQTDVVRVSRPRASFSSPDSLTCPERTVQFNNHSSGPSLRFFWDFGDGNTSSLRHPTHEYTADGNYTIKLVITDAYGCMDSVIKQNYIKVVIPTADFIPSDTIGTCPPLVVTFNNTSTHFTSWSWDFGDNTTSNAMNPSHFYAEPGVFNASLTVTGPGGCTSTKMQPIVVRGPQGSFVYDKTFGCDPLTVTFTATTLNRVSFVWDFNDGNTLITTDSVVTHTYTRPGNYLPKMLLQDAGGCIIPIVGPDTIRVRGVEPAFTFDNLNICDSGYVQFNNASSATEPISIYNWTFGNGQTRTDENPRIYFNEPGVFTIQLSVTTVNGCSGSFTSDELVRVSESPQPLITQTENGCAPISGSFSASLQNTDTTVIQWNWNISNGTQSDQQQVQNIPFTQAGTYQIQLTAVNGYGCTQTVESVFEAFAIPVLSLGSDNGIVCVGTPKQLNASGADIYAWSPAIDISCTDCPNPQVTPTAPITYTVIGSSIQGCHDTTQISLDIAHPINITYSRPDSLCAGESVRLQASGAHSYVWHPSSGLNNANIHNPVAAPNVTTNYMVVGYDDKNCFTDTAYVPITVFPQPRVEAGNDRTINVGHSLDLIPEISADVTNVTWSPTGSIFRSDYPSITVNPNTTTTYRVEVTNDGGCYAYDELTVYVICTGANVFIPNTFSPNGDGSNDLFYPRGTGLFRIKTAKIFNRWGELVYQRNDFSPNDESKGWDGTYKGQKLSSDVYVYIIEIMCDNNQVMPFKGNVTLLR